MRSGRFAAPALAPVMLVASIGLAPLTSPPGIVAVLNAERVANGIPGGLTLDPASTLGCEHHLRYEELNGIAWTDVEVPGHPGFTKDGQLAGVTGDQANTGGFDHGNPYDNLPVHLANLLDPDLTHVGAADDGQRSCVVLGFGGATRSFHNDAVFTYPGNGRTGVAPSQDVHNESPTSPGAVVGIPEGTTTGLTMIVFASGPWRDGGKFTVTAASLSGPRGAVAVRVVDPAAHPQLGPYVRTGIFFLVPVAPLPASAHMSASVTVAGTGRTLTKRWSFTTAA